MKYTFKDAGATAGASDTQVATAEAPDTQLAPPRPAQPLATYDSEAEYGAEDMERHVFQVVAKTGKLSNEFTPGDMLLNKETVIGNTKTPIEFAVVGMRKAYQNDLPFGDDMGDTVYSATEVIDRGGTHGYRDFNDKDSTHFWKPILQTVLLIQLPAGVTDPSVTALFPFAIGDASYAVAKHGVYTKTGYNGVAKKLIGLHQSQKLRGVADGEKQVLWKLTTKGESTPDGSRSWIQPTASVVGPLSADVIEFVRSLSI